MVVARLLVSWGRERPHIEEWGRYDFVALPSPGDRIEVDVRGADDCLTVLGVRHNLSSGSDQRPGAEVLATWANRERPTLVASRLVLALIAVVLLIGALFFADLVFGSLAVKATQSPTPVAIVEGSRATSQVQPPRQLFRSQPTTEQALVAAGRLNCRASPALRADSLRVLSRGESVQVLAREAGWSSISYNGRQCWVAGRYLTAESQI